MANMNPCKLHDLSTTSRESLTEYLTEAHKALMLSPRSSEYLLVGMEILLEALGAEGYDFS